MRSSHNNKFLSLSASFCIVFTLCIIITIIIIASSNNNVVEAAAAESLNNNVKFRCFRPFASLRTFSPKDMTRRDNCEFAPFMKIVDAHATVKCYDSSANSGADSQEQGQKEENNNGATSSDPQQKEGCYVTLNFTAQKFDPDHSANFHPQQFAQFFEEKKTLGKHLDSMRYTMELKALGTSTVRYKGFDNEGYSVCCSLLKNKNKNNKISHQQEEEEDEICEWVDVVVESNDTADSDTAASTGGDEENETTTRKKKATKVQKLTSKTACPLNNDKEYNAELIDGKRVYKNLIYGEVERPLHRKVFGKWEARIEFYRDNVDEGVGRLLIPFELSPAIFGGNDNDGQQKVFSSVTASTAAVASKSKSEGGRNEGAMVSVEKKE